MFWVRKMRQTAETALYPQNNRKTRPQHTAVIQDTVSVHSPVNSLLLPLLRVISYKYRMFLTACIIYPLFLVREFACRHSFESFGPAQQSMCYFGVQSKIYAMVMNNINQQKVTPS
jgi:hypothetical protein